MQRKNDILVPLKSSGRGKNLKATKRATQAKSKPAIAMITAIGMIVIISTILALSLSLSTQTTKRTADIYLHEQAVLLSKSAAEYALLQISSLRIARR